MRQEDKKIMADKETKGKEMADRKGFPGVVESLLQGMDNVLSAKTVVGQPVQVGDVTILPWWMSVLALPPGRAAIRIRTLPRTAEVWAERCLPAQC